MEDVDIIAKLIQKTTYKVELESPKWDKRDYVGWVDHEMKEIVVTNKCPHEMILAILAHEIMHSRKPKRSRYEEEFLATLYELHILWKYRKIEEIKYYLEDRRNLVRERTIPNIYIEVFKTLMKSNLWKRCEKLVEENENSIRNNS